MKKLILLSFAIVLMTAALQAQDTPKVVNGGFVNGKAVRLPLPGYPEALKGTDVEGMVAVNVLIDMDGAVISAEADPNDQRTRKNPDGTDADPVLVDPLLREAAENAARQARFAPTMLNGQGVQVKGKVIYNFVTRGAVSEAPGPAVMTGISVPDGAGPVKPHIRGSVLNGKALSLPAPVYPSAAKAVRAEGAVSVNVLLDEEGNVVTASAVSGHPLLRSAAESAAREAKFSPTFLNGNPVKIQGVLVFNFVLPNKGDQ